MLIFHNFEILANCGYLVDNKKPGRFVKKSPRLEFMLLSEFILRRFLLALSIRWLLRNIRRRAASMTFPVQSCRCFVSTCRENHIYGIPCAFRRK